MSKYHNRWTIKPLCLALGASLLLGPTISTAGRFQPFNGISYRNPAELTLFVKNAQFIVGDDRVDPDVTFNGSVTVPNPFASLTPLARPVTTNGRSSSTGIYNLPYGRMAARVKPGSPLIFDVDVTEPFGINISYPQTQPIRYAGTKFQISTVDISPIVAYQFSGKLSRLAVGAGVDFLYMWANFNSRYPTPLSPLTFGRGLDSVAKNSESGKTVGWHAGVLYHVLEKSFIGLTYFSTMAPKLEGKSTYTYPSSVRPLIPVQTENDNLFSTIRLPDTVVLNWLQQFNPIWKAEFVTSYTGWGRLQRLTLRNIAGPTNTLVSDLNYQNSWRYGVRNFIHVGPKWMLLPGIAYEVVPSNRFDRTAFVPSSNSVVVSLGAEYRIIPSVGLMANYSHVFFPKNIPIDNTSTTGRLTDGEANINADVVGMRLTVDIG